MLTHEEVFTSPFPSPSRSRGRTRFAPDYERSPPSNYINGGTTTIQTPGSYYRRSGTVPVQVTPVAAPSFTNCTGQNNSGVKISAGNDSKYYSSQRSHHKERRGRRELSVPYDASLNTSTSTVRPLTTVFTRSGSNTTKETTPPRPEPQPRLQHSPETERYLRKTEKRRREATERVIGEEDFRRLQASLESLQKTLKQTRSLLRESEKSGEWWKERVKVLDKRSRGLEVENRALGSRMSALEEENRLLREETALAAKAAKEREEEEREKEKEREREIEREIEKENSRVLQEKSFLRVNEDHGKENNHSGIIESAMAADGDEKSNHNKKDKMYTDAIRSLISQYWNMQTTLAVGATGTQETDGVCDCAAARTVQSILLGASAPSSSKNSSATSPTDATAPSIASGIDGDVNMDIDIDKPKELVVRIPPHPHPEIFSNLRRVRKKVLRKRVKEMKGYIEALRGENEVLEKVILERDGGMGMDLAADFDVTKL